jgi:hypothetical protein
VKLILLLEMEICKKREATLEQTEVNLFLAGFSVLKPLCKAKLTNASKSSVGKVQEPFVTLQLA